MQRYEKIISNFARKNILVIGDIMVDRFIYGNVSRISPEAPVPVVEISKEIYMAGGAANVVANIVSVGGSACVIGVAGEDFSAEYLLKSLNSNGIVTSGVIKDKSRPTILKTRIIAHHQQVVRVDREVKTSFDRKILDSLINNVHNSVTAADAVILSDYGKGVICEKLLKIVIPLARKRKIPITVDPKIEHFSKYKRVTCLTPNLNEATEGIKAIKNKTEEDVVNIGRKIMKKLRPDALIITRGEKGMTLFEPSRRIRNIPTRAKEVYDVTGAGDTVIAIFTLALASGASFYEATEISNYAAGIVVGKLGTATVTSKELLEALKEQK